MIEPEDMLRAAVGVGPWPVSALRELMREAGVRDWHLKRAVSSLTGADELVLLTQRFWADPSFLKEKGVDPLYIAGHSRAELIRRLSARAPASPGQAPSTTDDLMQGDGAERLAAWDYDREVQSWRGS